MVRNRRREEEMSRFFVTSDAVGSSTITITDRDDIHHMNKVLRLRPGDEVDISDQTEWEYRCGIESIDKDQTVLRILDKQKFTAEPETRVTLYQGIPKGSKMETIVQKTVELGIDTIVPVFMDRTVVVDKGGYGRKVERLSKIAAEAVKQCRRGVIPIVADAIRTKDMLAELSSFDTVLFPYENEKGTTMKDVLRGLSGDVRSIAVIIGPEGGFSEEEAEAIVEAGGLSVSLGKTTLRTETAGMAALAMIMYELEM